MSLNQFYHNEFQKKDYQEETEEFIVNINSKDRDTSKYPNPFNFRTTFRKNVAKDDFPYKWKKSKPGISDDVPMIKTYIKTDANIQADYKNIKTIDLNEIMCPRYIPTKHPGKKIDNVLLITNCDTSAGSYIAMLYVFPGYTASNDGDTIILKNPIDVETTIINNEDLLYLYDSETDTSFYCNILLESDTNTVMLDACISAGKYIVYNLSSSKNILGEAVYGTDIIISGTQLTYPNINIGYLLPNTLILINYGDGKYKICKIVSLIDDNTLTIEEVQDVGVSEPNNDAESTISYVNFSILDLGEEKLISVKINELGFPKDTATNTVQSEALGTLFPTLIADTTVCYTGLSNIQYNFRNLNKFNILTISLYDKNGNQLGEDVFPSTSDTYDYFKDYSKYQVNYVFNVVEVSRNL